MSYDLELADRIRRAIGARGDITEKAMFGGLSFLLNEKMFCGIVKQDLMVRVGPDRYQESLSLPHVRPMDFTGRPLKGYVYVAPEGCRTQAMVRSWAGKGMAFVQALNAPRPGRPPRQRPVAAAANTAFPATLFRYPGPGGWTFARVPDQHAPPVTHAWGRTAVTATVDGRSWDTSVWRDKKHGTLLPVPKRLLGKKGDGDVVSVKLRPREV